MPPSYFVRLGILFLLTLSVSCLGPREYTATAYYDLGYADQQEVKLNIGSILQEGPYRSRMIFRISKSEVQQTEYQRWTQSPDLMLTHYLKTGFSPGGEFSLEGEIIAFENDLSRKKAVFIFHYDLSKMSRKVYSGQFRMEKDSGETAEQFATAMGAMASELSKEIAGKIKSLN